MMYQTDWEAVYQQLPLLLEGAVFTGQITLTAYATSLVVGLVVALLALSPFAPLRVFGLLYTQILRSISIYIYIIWIYFGLAIAINLKLTPFGASVIAITLLHSAYLSEIYRSAILAVSDGQTEAARSLGLGRISIFFDVIFPQAMRTALPQLVSQFAMIIKDSSVVAMIGASDLMYETIRAANLEYRTFEFYTIAAVIYLTFVLCVSGLGSLLERRMRRSVA